MIKVHNKLHIRLINTPSVLQQYEDNSQHVINACGSIWSSVVPSRIDPGERNRIKRKIIHYWL